MKKLIDQLKKLDLPKDKFSVFGSGIMGILELKDPNDLDIIVTEDLWNILIKKYTIDKNKEYDCITIGDIEIIHDYKDYNINDMINNSTIINNIRFVNVETILNFKIERNLEKDKKDVKILEEYIYNNREKIKEKIICIDCLKKESIENMTMYFGYLTCNKCIDSRIEFESKE